jgi:hypothetical protein
MRRSETMHVLIERAITIRTCTLKGLGVTSAN